MVTTAVHDRLARAPQTWVYVVAGAAMVLLVANHVAGSMPHPVAATDHHAHGHHMPGAPMPDQAPNTLASTWLWWTVMAVAMMFPLAAAGARRIALASLWRRRHLAIGEYLVGYLSVWAVAGLVAIVAVAAVWPDGAPPQAVPVVLLIAALWQVYPVRRRALARCRGSGFVNVRGWRADRDCVADGWNYGTKCLLTCGPVMAVMAVGHSLIVMACVTVLLLTERARGPNPAQRAGRPLEAVGLVVIAGAVYVWGLSTEMPLP
ncbi:DUF2182 domain-containing protein [Mycolicibacterium wolinskyi]|uniref:DUF2182 domain-containing protein n=1 Tax=Mycolicibacterium wolinskyi TaxID=59750 RepID=A0A1X2EU03_9MYCO|nr:MULTISPECIES: DUF2182 domain-containing protein [Mycolicibacterium]MCV7286907.1 DUF2182 domain-containing protein [Mycolicibacterium wolinskyi]MCV7292400.1 DUF2182 domain-containing protein [Mycolicibacterium goodii]ORX09633.1 hypothetical protein AWC31_05200 [Mycolicibacterium wolinskyi]